MEPRFKIGDKVVTAENVVSLVHGRIYTITNIKPVAAGWGYAVNDEDITWNWYHEFRFNPATETSEIPNKPKRRRLVI